MCDGCCALEKECNDLHVKWIQACAQRDEYNQRATAASNVTRIAKQAITDSRNMHNNTLVNHKKTTKVLRKEIGTLQRQVNDMKNDLMIMFARSDTQEEQIQIKDGQVAFMRCLVNVMADEMEKLGISVTYEELVQRVEEIGESKTRQMMKELQRKK